MALHLPNRSIIRDESEIGVADPDFQACVLMYSGERRLKAAENEETTMKSAIATAVPVRAPRALGRGHRA
jgi:hypothetical protein